MGVDRLTIQDAARRLGVSEGAIRKRVARNTFRHDKAEDGRIYVYLDEGDTRRVDEVQDAGVVRESEALISRLEGEVEFLRDQVRRQQEIIAQQTLTMRQLSAPQEASESPEAPETVEEEPERAEPRPAAGGAQEAARRPWWRRVFGPSSLS